MSAAAHGSGSMTHRRQRQFSREESRHEKRHETLRKEIRDSRDVLLSIEQKLENLGHGGGPENEAWRLAPKHIAMLIDARNRSEEGLREQVHAAQQESARLRAELDHVRQLLASLRSENTALATENAKLLAAGRST